MELLDLLGQAVDVFLHLDVHLNAWSNALGPWLYVVLFAIVFCETGLVITPFLPGDSLLFAAGALASIEGSPIRVPLLLASLIVAAVLGDAVNYAAGKHLGPRVFKREDSFFFHKKHLVYTESFYRKHGGKTIILARFMPIVRTFAPFVAGIGRMGYRRFAAYNLSGGVLWVASFVLAGYWFGAIPVVQRNFHIVIVVIIALSVVPAVVEFLRERRRTAREAGAAPGPAEAA